MYYLWLKEAQAGPYTLQQVQSMWNAGEITALTLYWQDGNAEWQPLNTILSTLEPSQPPPAQTRTAVLPQFEQTIVHKSKPAVPQNTPAIPTEAHPEQNLWTGHPTLWKWAGQLILGIILCLLPVGLFVFLNQSLLITLAPLPFALIIFFHIFLTRNSTRYAVTNKHVSLETGIFNKNSRELRIEDIRSIAAKMNFLGYGDVEFSSAASDDAEVTFVAVSNAAAVRDLVKKLQS